MKKSRITFTLLLFTTLTSVAIISSCKKTEVYGGGANSLIHTTAEPIGSNCEYGGVKIETGVDLNGNNILDANEVNSTAFACNGATGVDTVESQSYYAILNQSGTNPPQSNVIENSLNVSITWSRISPGQYLGTLNENIDLSKTILLTTNDRWVKCWFQSDHEIYLMNEEGIGSWKDNGVSNYTIEIRTFN